MADIEKVPQEQERNIVEKFREVLDRKPEQNIWLGVNGKVEESEEDTIVALYEKDDLQSIPLQQEKKIFKKAFYLEMSDVKVGKFSETSSQSVEKTIYEQLKEIVEKKGYPTRIIYVRNEINNIVGEDNSFYGVFPFSEISEDLGL